MRRRILELACVLAAAAGCAKEEPAKSAKSPTERLDAAQTATDAKDWKTALAELDLVIADPKATGEEKSQAWADKVYCEALANGDDAAKSMLKKADDAKVEFTALQYYKLGTSLKDADRFDLAIEVVTIATKKFENDAKAKSYFDKLAKQLLKKLKAAGNTDGAEKLRAIGYASGDDEDE
jgi:hypothetical protein